MGRPEAERAFGGAHFFEYEKEVYPWVQDLKK
jgi:hypothetical protein